MLMAIMCAQAALFHVLTVNTISSEAYITSTLERPLGVVTMGIDVTVVGIRLTFVNI